MDQAFDNYFDISMLQKHDGDSYCTQQKSHGRQVGRLALTNKDLSVLGSLGFDKPELKTMGVVVTIRQEEAMRKESKEMVKYNIR